MKKATTNSRRRPSDIDEYLHDVAPEQRELLEKVRRTIRSAAPKAEEVISYQIPTFKYLGPLIAFAAFKKHCSLFVMSYDVLRAYEGELKPFMGAKATIHFSSEQPLSAALIKKLVKARIAENESRSKARAAKRASA